MTTLQKLIYDDHFVKIIYDDQPTERKNHKDLEDLPDLYYHKQLALHVKSFSPAASSQANLAFKMTIIEDTHLALIDIPSKVEANNSLIFLPLQTYERKICRVFVPVHIYNSLV